MLISYDAYRVFYTVARLGSFTKAAGTLLSSQPNLTRTIRNLESAARSIPRASSSTTRKRKPFWTRRTRAAASSLAAAPLRC